MSLQKDARNILKALGLGRGTDGMPLVNLDSVTAGVVRADNQPLSGIATVASAAAMPVPATATVVVSGTTNITSIASGGYDGQRVTYIFQSTPTFTDGNNLKIAGNLVATADDTISLVCFGDNWYETGRAVN